MREGRSDDEIREAIGADVEPLETSVGAGVSHMKFVGVVRSTRITGPDIRAGVWDAATVELLASTGIPEPARRASNKGNFACHSSSPPSAAVQPAGVSSAIPSARS